jgi:hypothetical protein
VRYKSKGVQSHGSRERSLKLGPEPNESFEGQSPKHNGRDTEQETAAGGDLTARSYHEEQIQKAIAWFTSYVCSERDGYYGLGKPLIGDLRERMEGYFESPLLDQVRVLELKNHRVSNPWFYPIAREKGIRHLPDITHKAAVTFLDVVVFNEKLTSRDLFHGLVHAAQVNVLGLEVFADLFVRGFLRARSYFLVPLKAQAFSLDARFAANPGKRFSAEQEIREWWHSNRY